MTDPQKLILVGFTWSNSYNLKIGAFRILILGVGGHFSGWVDIKIWTQIQGRNDNVGYFVAVEKCKTNSSFITQPAKVHHC